MVKMQARDGQRTGFKKVSKASGAYKSFFGFNSGLAALPAKPTRSGSAGLSTL